MKVRNKANGGRRSKEEMRQFVKDDNASLTQEVGVEVILGISCIYR